MSTPAPRPISSAKLALPVITLVLAIAAVVVGAVLTSNELSALKTALGSPNATAVDVYGGQSAISIASAVLGAGIVAVVISLATFAVLFALGAFRQAEPAVIVDEYEFDDIELLEDADPAVAAAPVAEPAPAAVAPVAADDEVTAATPVDAPAAPEADATAPAAAGDETPDKPKA